MDSSPANVEAVAQNWTERPVVAWVRAGSSPAGLPRIGFDSRLTPEGPKLRGIERRPTKACAVVAQMVEQRSPKPPRREFEPSPSRWSPADPKRRIAGAGTSIQIG